MVAIQSVWPVSAWHAEGEGRRISHVPGPGPDWRRPMPALQAPVPGVILNLLVICTESTAEALFALKKLSLVISYGSWLNDSSVGWQILWQKYRGGTSKPEQKVRGAWPSVLQENWALKKWPQRLQKYGGGTSKAERKVRERDPQFCRNEPWRKWLQRRRNTRKKTWQARLRKVTLMISCL